MRTFALYLFSLQLDNPIKVADGVCFAGGPCAIGYASIIGGVYLYSTLEKLLATHCDDSTKLIWRDGFNDEPLSYNASNALRTSDEQRRTD